jgi:hypothetical protein
MELVDLMVVKRTVAVRKIIVLHHEMCFRDDRPSQNPEGVFGQSIADGCKVC